MAVQVVTVPPPAAGADWTFTVPAQWLPYLYGVTAVLTTATALTTIPDDSGNGHTANIQGTLPWTFGNAGPFVGGIDNFAVGNTAPSFVPGGAFAITPVEDAAFQTANFSADGWINITDFTTAEFMGMFGLTQPSATSSKWGMCVNNTTANPYDESSYWGGARDTGLAAVARNAFHHVGVSYDGVTRRLYLDGVLNSGVAKGAPVPGAGGLCATVGGTNPEGGLHGFAGATAFYGATLAAGNFAAHAAANASYATYKAAVLADTPIALYGLNTVPTGANRLATLVITDGTRKVAQFPASFPTITAQSFTWSWQVLGPGAASTTDGQTNSVPIPELQVDAGYTIGVVTLDKAGTDRWSDIKIWFDDGTGPAGGGGGVGGAFAGGLLVPDYSHSGG